MDVSRTRDYVNVMYKPIAYFRAAEQFLGLELIWKLQKTVNTVDCVFISLDVESLVHG